MKLPKKIAMMLTITLVTGNGMASLVNADSKSTEERLVGSGRWETAIQVSKKGWTSAKEAIIVNDSAIADALAATPFADAKDAPILLTGKDKLDEKSKAELKRLGVKKVYLIGGEDVLSKNIENDLKAEKLVIERIKGDTRELTALEIAKKLDGIKDISEIAVVNGTKGLADAVSIAAAAADKDMAIILSNPSEGTKASDEFIKKESIKTSYVIGGETVMPSGVASKLPNAKRIEGKDRNETNAKVIETFYEKSELNNAYVAKDGIRKEDQLIDALAVGVLAAKKDAPVIIVDKKLNKIQKEIINTKNFKTVTQVGGNGNEDAFNELKSMQDVTTYNVKTVKELNEALDKADANDIINMNPTIKYDINEDITIKTDKVLTVNLFGNYKKTITISACNAKIVNKGTVAKIVFKECKSGIIENLKGAKIINLEIQESAKNITIINKGIIGTIKNNAYGTSIDNTGGTISNPIQGTVKPPVTGTQPPSTGGGSTGGGGGTTTPPSQSISVTNVNVTKNDGSAATNPKQSDILKANVTYSGGTGSVRYQWFYADDIGGTTNKHNLGSGQTQALTNVQVGKYVFVTVTASGTTTGGSKTSPNIGKVVAEKEEIPKFTSATYQIGGEQFTLHFDVGDLNTKIKEYNINSLIYKTGENKEYKLQDKYTIGMSQKGTYRIGLNTIDICLTDKDINGIQNLADFGNKDGGADKIYSESVEDKVVSIMPAPPISVDSKQAIANSKNSFFVESKVGSKILTTRLNFTYSDDLNDKLEYKVVRNGENATKISSENEWKTVSKSGEDTEDIIVANTTDDVYVRVKKSDMTTFASHAVKAIDNVEALLSNNASIERVIALIDSIGDVTFEDGQIIRDARKAYDALSAKDKELVTNYSKLENAEKSYPKIETYHYFNKTKDLMNQIPNNLSDIKLSHKDVIKNARMNFDNIDYSLLEVSYVWGKPIPGTKDQGEYNLLKIKLTSSENRLNDLIQQEKDDTDAANKVVDKINAIGDVELSDECIAKIQDARKAYDALNPNAKSKITAEQLKVLTDAEDKYNELNPLPGIKSEAIKQLSTYVELKYYDDIAKTKINGYISEATESINNVNKDNIESSKQAIDIIVSETKQKIDSVEVTADIMRKNSIEQFKKLKEWKLKLNEIKENANNDAVSTMIDIQIGIVENEYGLGSSVNINNDEVTIDKLSAIRGKTYKLNDKYQDYSTESKISKGIDDAIKRAEGSDKLIQGELKKIIDGIFENGLNIPIGSYTVQNIPIPAGMNKENTIQALANLLTVEDFEININPKTGVAEIPSDKLDLDVLEAILEESTQEQTKIDIDDLINLLKKIPPVTLNIRWNTDGFSSELGNESQVDANISLTVNIEDIVELATDPVIEEIINSLLEGKNIDLGFIKSMAEYLELDLSEYEISVGYKLGFDFKVIDIALNTTVELPTLKLPNEISPSIVNKILDDITNDYTATIIGNPTPVLFKVVADWSEYTNECKELVGTIKIQINDIVFINHKTIVPVERVNMTEYIQSVIDKIKVDIENALNNEKVQQIIQKIKELKDFINSLPSLNEETKEELQKQIQELEIQIQQIELN